MRLKKEKCEFKKTQVEYLGHVVDAQGLRPAEKKLSAIKDAPEPANVSELKAFLGLLNYYNRFLPQLSTTLQPLHVLLEKNTHWKWQKEQKRAFQEAKQKLLESGVLTHYDLQKPVRLTCDASPYGVGACLSHVMADGSVQPIAFTSRTLSKAERGYAQLEREALALIFGVKQFHKYLVGRSFTLVTDHRPLLKILGPKEGVPSLAAARLQRWALILSAYNYNLEFTSGATNKEADMLSRLPVPVDVIDPNEEIYGLDYCEHLPVTSKEVATETSRDPVLRKAYQQTLCGWDFKANIPPELQPYARRAKELTVEKGCLLWGNRVTIPPKLQATVREELHEGQLGISRMKALARSFVWWPNLDRDIENLVKSCPECQSCRNVPGHTVSHPWVFPEGPWRRIHADFAEWGGKQYLLLIDAFSKWPEIHELGTHATAMQTVEAMRRSFSFHGIPHRLVTDNGPQFIAHEFQEFVRTNGIKHQRTPPYHPASNGQAERLVQELKKSLKTKPGGRSISHQISLFLLKYRTTPNCTTGRTPAEMLRKRELRTKLTLLRPDVGGDMRDTQQDRYQQATALTRSLNPGQTVSVLNPRRDGRGKWLYGVVLQRLGPVNYLVKVDGQPRYVHIEHLRVRDAMSLPVTEPTEAIGVNTPDTTAPVATPVEGEQPTGQPSDLLDVPTQPAQESPPSTQQAAATAATQSTEVTEEPPGRRYPQRQNRQIPVRYRSA